MLALKSKTNVYLFLFANLLLENAKITKTPFLGENCLAELEIGKKFFGK
jgi:hypothetical protein